MQTLFMMFFRLVRRSADNGRPDAVYLCFPNETISSDFIIVRVLLGETGIYIIGRSRTFYVAVSACFGYGAMDFVS